MKTVAILLAALALSGCSTIQKYWPRAHDPVLVDAWVSVYMAVDAVRCSDANTGWAAAREPSQRLYLLADFRKDPQADNLRGLRDHVARMSQGGSVVFCQIGVKTAQSRLAAARSAWEGR